MPAPIQPVNPQANEQPHYEANPGLERQPEHQQKAEGDRNERHVGHARNAERTVHVRCPVPEQEHAGDNIVGDYGEGGNLVGCEGRERAAGGSALDP